MSLVTDEDRTAAHGIAGGRCSATSLGEMRHCAACEGCARAIAEARERENKACEDILHSYAAMGDEIGWIEAINHARLAIAARRGK